MITAFPCVSLPFLAVCPSVVRDSLSLGHQQLGLVLLVSCLLTGVRPVPTRQLSLQLGKQTNQTNQTNTATGDENGPLALHCAIGLGPTEDTSMLEADALAAAAAATMSAPQPQPPPPLTPDKPKRRSWFGWGSSPAPAPAPAPASPSARALSKREAKAAAKAAKAAGGGGG
eukprot:SAG22_NODE_8863_length_625_cov_1.342205_2_plen_171_part_01